MNSQDIKNGIINGLIEQDRASVNALVEQGLNGGMPPMELLNDALTVGLRQMGELFAEGEIFLPELLLSADIVTGIMDRLSSKFEDCGKVEKRGKCLFATVAGDVHDIGKSLVCMIFNASGYEVIDAGKDVPNERLIKLVEEHNPDIVGLSSLLSTTMPAQSEFIEMAREAGIRDRIKILIGGAPTSRDWAENRAKIPQDFIRNTIGKVFDSLYSTGERDKFRTRLERNANGGTDIFVTHRGMEEVYSSARRDSTVWQPRARDPELEAEFMRRMMVKLGVSQEQAKAALATAATTQAAAPNARVVAAAGGAPAVQLAEDFDRAWRRVGLALDRTGFTVEDRDRSKGLYFVRYIDPTVEKKEAGFFGRLLGRGSQQLPTSQYQIAVRSEGQSSVVTVNDRAGAPAASADAQRIVKVLADELK